MSEEEDYDLFVKRSIAITILSVTVALSFITCLVVVSGLSFVKVRAVNKIKYLASLITRAESRLSLQCWTDDTLEKLAKKIGGGSLELLRQERTLYGRQVRGEAEKVDSLTGKHLSKESDFKLPANLYDEARHDDTKFQTLHLSYVQNVGEVFLNKELPKLSNDKKKK